MSSMSCIWEVKISTTTKYTVSSLSCIFCKIHNFKNTEKEIHDVLHVLYLGGGREEPLIQWTSLRPLRCCATMLPCATIPRCATSTILWWYFAIMQHIVVLQYFTFYNISLCYNASLCYNILLVCNTLGARGVMRQIEIRNSTNTESSGIQIQQH